MEERQEVKLTEIDIEGLIESETYMKVGLKTTVCLITLKNGFEVIGTSACVDPAAYSEDIGKRLSREKAKDTIWLVAGYELQVRKSEGRIFE